MQSQDRDTREPHENSEPIQDPWRWTRQEVRPQRDEEIALAIQRHAANQVAQRGAEDNGQQETRARKGYVAQLPPHRMVQMRSQFQRESTEHEQPEHDNESEIEAAEPGRVGLGKREEQ